ncbi:MAG: ABC transporter ATP-binding protein [Desulfobulbaceae bacterium]|nr:ABC transporter ATP-binding protein [Desulfobulbaceae bacterium]
MIHLSDIDFRYPSGGFHLSIPDLSVEADEKVAVIGPSGSGKTTLLNMVAGILTPHSGSVIIDDDAISTFSDAARRDFRITNIGYIFQDFGLIDYLNVRDNILHPYRITKTLKMNTDVRGKARWLAKQMGIGDKLDRHPDNLSHGERQRVTICRALLPGPKLILADEATGNLDPDNKTHILELLFQAVTDHNATLLAVTHDQELLHHFDRVINFRDFLKGRAA